MYYLRLVCTLTKNIENDADHYFQRILQNSLKIVLTFKNKNQWKNYYQTIRPVYASSGDT